TSGVLRVIASAPADLDAVLNEILERAAHLCGADRGSIGLRESDLLRRSAYFNPEPWLPALGSTHPVAPGTVAGTSVLERRTVHVWGTSAEMRQQYPESPWVQRAAPDERRTALSVPLLREGEAIGQMQLRRPGGVPFSAEQVALVESFADQAVI